MRPELIMDVGMHDGEDTAFYLDKGFEVVAVEANPVLVERARVRFAAEIAAGRLTIVDRAIAAAPGPIDLFVNDRNDVWSTIDPDYRARNTRIGAASTPVSVQAVAFADVLAEHGVPYYLKIDIEGVDNLCILALHGAGSLPVYVSVETSGTGDTEQTFESLAHLFVLGYRGFKLVNQVMVPTVRLPQPALEGRFVEHRFKPGSSGGFGNETPGAWTGAAEIAADCVQMVRRQARVTIQSRYYNRWLAAAYYRIHRLLGSTPVGWYDLHARLAPPDG